MPSLPSMLSAASLLAMLSRSDAEQVLSRLPAAKAASLRSYVPPRTSTTDDLSVARRFLHEYRVGRRDSSALRIDAAHDRTGSPDHPESPPFHFLHQYLPSRIAELLGQELPQTVAVVLGKLPPSKAADVLATMHPDVQVAVVRHMASSERVPDEVLQELADSLRYGTGSVSNP